MRGRRFDALLKNTSPLQPCSTAQSMRMRPPAPRLAMVSALPTGNVSTPDVNGSF